MNYSTQPGTSYLSIGANGINIAGVFLHPERVHITQLAFEGESERYLYIPPDELSKP